MPRPASIETARCGWARTPLMIRYHDREWGVPVHDDRTLFEFLVLDGAQAGLSWETILRKRENFRAAFDRFDYRKVSAYDGNRVRALLRDPGIIRNRAKIEAAVENARRFIQVRAEFGTFDTYIWRFVGGRPRLNHRRSLKGIPPTTPLAEAMSRDLRARGFRFVGPTICYAFMQAAGLVNDHLVSCFRHSEVGRMPASSSLLPAGVRRGTG